MKGYVNKLQPSGSKYGIMLIGINPSRRSTLEDVWKDRFGKDLLKYLNEAGIDKDDLWMTNLFKSPTPDNRKLSEEEKSYGMKDLWKEINEVQPSCLILMGKQVYEEFAIFGPFQTSMIFLDYDEGIPIYSVPHVAYISRTGYPELEKRFISFLKEIHDKERIC